MLLMIDNYDSFTYNLVQYFSELNQDVKVVRNDQITLDEIAELNPEHIVISPGPSKPDNAGISMAVIQTFMSKKPILGVCLGHQCIGQVLGANITHANQIMHGKTSSVYHTEKGVFRDLPSPFCATRYHSLVIDKDSLPDTLEVTAWTKHDDNKIDEIMGVKHTVLPLQGVQFHPESILTEHGHQLLQNFLQL